jgi:hypothetical protein
MPCKWHVQFRMLFIGCCTPPSFTTSSPPPWSNVLYKTGGSSGIYSPTRLPIQTQSDTHRQTCISCPTAVHQYLVIIRLPLITTSYLVHATIPYLPTVPFGGRLGTIVNFLYPTFIIYLCIGLQTPKSTLYQNSDLHSSIDIRTIVGYTARCVFSNLGLSRSESFLIFSRCLCHLH